MNLFTQPNGNIKLAKSKSYYNIGLSLSPHKISGYNTCPHATPGCIHSCINLSGNGYYPNVQLARIKKTKLFFENRQLFLQLLEAELDKYVRYCHNKRIKLAVRLNVFSDITWEKIAPHLFNKFADVQFYDYTKNFKRLGKTPSNYHLTFSRSELNHKHCKRILQDGFNVAVPFKVVPRTYLGYPVIDGEKNDLRFLDKHGVVGLKAKAKGIRDTSGFVI